MNGRASSEQERDHLRMNFVPSVRICSSAGQSGSKGVLDKEVSCVAVATVPVALWGVLDRGVLCLPLITR